MRGSAFRPVAGFASLFRRLATAAHSEATYLQRVNNILETLLRYTTMDFTTKASVGDDGDDIDRCFQLLDEIHGAPLDLLSRVRLGSVKLKTVRRAKRAVHTAWLPPLLPPQQQRHQRSGR